jgi:hypothetical protein
VIPALRTTLLSLGFALGFFVLLSGGAGLAAIVFDLVHADVPSWSQALQTALFLAVPLLAFRAYDKAKLAP